MSKNIKDIVDRIHKLETELETELEKRGAGIREKLSHLDEDLLQAHRSVRVGVVNYLLNANILYILTSPAIYMLIIPFALLDLMVSIYQGICFRIYKIPLVKRSDYMAFDRSKLAYLNKIEQINCLYCSYGNGVIAYVREVSARTEMFWCPIKHATRISGAHKYYHLFEEFGDGEDYQSKLRSHREATKTTYGGKPNNT